METRRSGRQYRCLAARTPGQVVYEETEEFLGELMPSLDMFVEVLGRWSVGKTFIPTRLYINGFEICDDNMKTYGWGVYLAPRFFHCSICRPHQLFTNHFSLLNFNDNTFFSILDHSCQPNCVVSFSGPLLTVRALAPLNSLDEAFISYVDPGLPGPVRSV